MTHRTMAQVVSVVGTCVARRVTAVVGTCTLLAASVPAGCLAANRMLIYHMRDGNLYYCTIDGLSAGDEILLKSGGWSGQLAFDNGYLYRLSNDELRAIPVQNDAGTDLGPSISIGQGGWGGDNATFAVNNQYVYLMKGDHLYGANLRVSNALDQLRSEGGWHGYIAVADGFLFL